MKCWKVKRKLRESEREFSHSGQQASSMHVSHPPPSDFRRVSRRVGTFDERRPRTNERTNQRTREKVLPVPGSRKNSKFEKEGRQQALLFSTIPSGCIWQRPTAPFERFGLFSGQVFARPLRNQPPHCPADNTFTASSRGVQEFAERAVHLRPLSPWRSSDLSRSLLVERLVFSARLFRKFDLTSHVASTFCAPLNYSRVDSVFIETIA